MLCFGGGSAEDKEKAKRSKRLDNKLANRAKKMNEEKKLLLLGSGESGKSTIFKQMKILGAGGYSQEELKDFRPIVASNCITQIQVLISAMDLLGIPYGSEENKSIAEELAELPSITDAWDADLAKKIGTIWNDEGIQKAYQRRDTEFQLNDSAGYFLSNVGRFEDPEFIPTVNDVLQARVRTTGIEEAEFDVLDFQFRMLDVGGQRSERRKWIHCFDCVTAVIFTTSLSEYDQTLREDDGQNRMKESLLLFQEIRNSPWFRAVPFILFLNKIDLFQEKITRVSLDTCFPEDWKVSDPSKQKESECKEFIRKKFLERDTDGISTVTTHYTCALDTENIRVIFSVVKSEILNAAMGEIMLF